MLACPLCSAPLNAVDNGVGGAARAPKEHAPPA
jgi:uncharacterized protein YbaR (Trm112 family)